VMEALRKQAGGATATPAVAAVNAPGK
jgi:hypothetical protein